MVLDNMANFEVVEKKDYFSQVKEGLKNFLLGKRYTVTTLTTRDGVKYPVIEVYVINGTLLISTMTNQWNKDAMCLRLENWKVQRPNHLWRFKRFVNPKDAQSYVEAFLTADTDSLSFSHTMMESSRCFDNDCRGNFYKVKAHSFDGTKIEMELIIGTDGPQDHTLTITQRQTGKTEFVLKHNGKVVRRYASFIAPWDMRSTLTRTIRSYLQ